jgi:uncharacterized membrane protein YeaQ/YmgE (transglycosylase-associated protein family)
MIVVGPAADGGGGLARHDRANLEVLRMGTIGAIIGLIIFGAVIGVLARLVLPGKQNISLPMTIILGIIGAIAGYYIWGALGGGNTRGIDVIRWIISIIVAAVLVSIYGAMTGRSNRSVR